MSDRKNSDSYGQGRAHADSDSFDENYDQEEQEVTANNRKGGKSAKGGNNNNNNNNYDDEFEVDDQAPTTKTKVSPGGGRARAGAGAGANLVNSNANNDDDDDADYPSDSENNGLSGGKNRAVAAANYKALPMQANGPGSGPRNGKSSNSMVPGKRGGGAANTNNNDDDDEDEEDDEEDEDEEEDEDDARGAITGGKGAAKGSMLGGGGGGGGGAGTGMSPARGGGTMVGLFPPSTSPGLTGVPPPKVGYSPADFTGLKVSDEVRELLGFIGRYTPHAVELETRLRPFIPEYVAAIGDVDPFIKPPRPDGKDETLGALYLDEPSAIQSDATVLSLQLRALSKKSGLDPIAVRSIEHAEKNPKEITKWIQSIADLHRSKPPPSVHYSKVMPDIEVLMQEWPPAFEEMLKDITLPGADTALTLEEFARVVCGICDVPVYGSLVQSLHVLFTLYNEFRSNAHFQALQGPVGAGGGGGNGGGGGGGGGNNQLLNMALYDDEEHKS